MATFIELQQQVLRRVIDAPTAVTTEVPSLVRKALRWMQDQHNFRVMEDAEDYTTTAGSNTLGTLPTNFKQFRDEPYEQPETAPARYLSIAPNRRAARIQFGPEDEGPPEVLVEGQKAADGTGSLVVYPLPDGNSDYSDGEYRITVPYWGYLTLADDSSTNWFTENGGEDVIVARATAEGFRLDWAEDKADYWDGQAMVRFAEFKRMNKSQIISRTPTLGFFTGARSARIVR